MTIGFASIGLWDPKWDGNVGGALRAAYIFGAQMVAIQGPRLQHKGRIERTDPNKSHRNMPVMWVDDIMTACPHEAVPVAVEFLNQCCPLPKFIHPRNAYYVFGGEDRTLRKDILAKCHYHVMVPTLHCMNLAATVNVILYDRLTKEY